MIEDGRTVPADSTVEADVCIIGAGPAGLAMASQLEGSGVKLCLIESGGRHPEGRQQQLAKGENADADYYRLQSTRLRGFAGTSNHWRPDSGFRTRPLDALDFEERPEIGRPGWPFPRSELDEAYAVAHDICRLGPYDTPVGHWERPGAEQLPLRTHGVDTWCFQIGPLDVFTSQWDTVERMRDVRILLHSTVAELQSRGDRVTGARVFTGDGRSFHVRARAYVLAAGGIENARLLLLSSADRPAGLGNENDLVGRYFMEHPHVRSGVLVPDQPELLDRLSLYSRHVVDGTEVVGMFAPTPEALRGHGALGSAWAVHPVPAARVSPAGRQLSEVRDLLAYRRRLPGTAKRLGVLLRHPVATASAIGASRLGSGAPTRCLLHGMTEQEPNPASRVTLGRRRDRNGQLVARLDWRLTDRDRHSIRAGQDIVDGALRSAGLGRVEAKFGDDDPSPVVGGGFHHMGTTRMDDDPRHGVVDSSGRVHSVTNLYVTGASVFPTGGVANPTLTIVALAVRLANTLARQLRTV